MSNIKISELTPFSGSLTGDDYFPINESSSATTYRIEVQELQNYLSTGSFSGSFSGELVGTSNTTGSLYGTASWALNVISASFADRCSTASLALTASLSNTASSLVGGIGVSGAGTANYIPIWTNTTVLGDSSMYYTSSRNSYNLAGRNFIVETGAQSFIVCRSSGVNSNIRLESAYSSSDSWTISMVTTATGSTRGLLEILTNSSSNQFTEKEPNDPDGQGTVRLMRTVSNGIYFWPFTGAQSLSRDGTFNIGVDSSGVSTQNTQSRLMIEVFSGSSVSNPQTNHLFKAIEVRYGSSSLETTFCVSSSGNVFASGRLDIDNNITHNEETYYGLDSVTYPTGIRLDATSNRYFFLNLANSMTASIDMKMGQTIDVIVNQAGSPSTASIHFTGSFLSSSGNYFAAPIIWPTGSTSPQNYTGSTNTASLYRFFCVRNGGNGPGGNNGTYPHQKVIFGELVIQSYF